MIAVTPPITYESNASLLFDSSKNLSMYAEIIHYPDSLNIDSNYPHEVITTKVTNNIVTFTAEARTGKEAQGLVNVAASSVLKFSSDIRSAQFKAITVDINERIASMKPRLTDEQIVTILSAHAILPDLPRATLVEVGKDTGLPIQKDRTRDFIIMMTLTIFGSFVVMFVLTLMLPVKAKELESEDDRNTVPSASTEE